MLGGHTQDVGQRDVVPNYPGFGKVVDPERLNVTEVPRLILVPEPGANGPTLLQHFPRLRKRQGQTRATNFSRPNHQRYARIKDGLHSRYIIGDIELFPSLFVGKTHLYYSNSFHNRGISKNG